MQLLFWEVLLLWFVEHNLCNHTIVKIRLLLGKISILFYQKSLFGLALRHIKHCWLSNAKSCFIYILDIWFANKFCWYTLLNVQTILIQTIQFSISHLFAFVKISDNSIWPRDRNLLGATTQGLSGPGTNDNEGVFLIPRSFSNTIVLCHIQNTR